MFWLIRNAEEAHPGWRLASLTEQDRAWQAANLGVTAHAPWPDPTSSDFFVWLVATPDVGAWVPTPRQHDQRIADARAAEDHPTSANSVPPRMRSTVSGIGKQVPA